MNVDIIQPNRRKKVAVIGRFRAKRRSFIYANFYANDMQIALALAELDPVARRWNSYVMKDALRKPNALPFTAL